MKSKQKFFVTRAGLGARIPDPELVEVWSIEPVETAGVWHADYTKEPPPYKLSLYHLRVETFLELYGFYPERGTKTAMNVTAEFAEPTRW